MKRILSILIVLLLCLSVFVGCEDEKHISMNDEDIHTEYAGVYLTLTSVDDSGEHKKLKAVWQSNSTISIDIICFMWLPPLVSFSGTTFFVNTNSTS